MEGASLSDLEKKLLFGIVELINIEPKALVVSELTDSPQGATELRNRIREEYALSKPLPHKIIKTYLADLPPSPLIIDSYQEGHRGFEVPHWHLSERGLAMKPLLEYLMTFLSVEHGISNYAVFGPINSISQERATHVKMEILLYLSDGKPHSMAELVDRTGYSVKIVKEKLHDLANVLDADGNKVDFVEQVNVAKGRGFSYYATGKAFDRKEFGKKARKIISLCMAIGQLKDEFELSYLQSLGLYENFDHLSFAIGELEDRGYLTRTPRRVFETYRVIGPGHDFARNGLLRALEYIRGDKRHRAFILRNEPSHDEKILAAETYARFKHFIANAERVIS